MLSEISPTECDRARESVSVRLDGELSELDGARLDDHLRECANCSAYARESHALTAQLRAASLEQPTVTVFVPARRRPLLRLQTAAAAAAIVAIAAGSSFAVGRALAPQGRPAITTSSTSDVLGLRADVVNQHMLAMLRHLEPAPEARVGRVILL
jgi:predicted anti-sigma-YlaC factor YlaD